MAEMEEDMRDELFHYFERDIGRPPVGARARVLSGLRGTRPERTSRPVQWLAASAAMVLVVVAIGILVLPRVGPRQQPAGPAALMPARTGAAVGYDAGRGRLVVFGGTAKGVALGDTWTWDGRRWTLQHPAVSPPPLGSGGAMAFDDDRGTVVLYGEPGATWTWDGRTWRQGAPGPIPEGPHAMAYDPASRTVLLYGASGLWSWDGARWSQLHPSVLPAVNAQLMAWDGRRIILEGEASQQVGGQYVTETWAWDGGAWSRLSPAVRLPIGTAVAVYDQGHASVVAYVVTEDTQSSETWVWDGATWRKEHPAHQPPAWRDPAVVYDRGTDRVVLYGGDLWTWDGGDWTLLEEGAR